jgi:hypothetical protein
MAAPQSAPNRSAEVMLECLGIVTDRPKSNPPTRIEIPEPTFCDVPASAAHRNRMPWPNAPDAIKKRFHDILLTAATHNKVGQ